MIEVATETPGQLWDRITILRIRAPLLKTELAVACQAECYALEHAFTTLCIAASRGELPAWMLHRKAHKLRAIHPWVPPDQPVAWYKDAIAKTNQDMWDNEAARDKLIIAKQPSTEDLIALQAHDFKEQKLNQGRHALIDALDHIILNQAKGTWKWVPCE